jgi:hypothetical protein
MCCEFLVTKSGIWQAEDEKNLFHEMSQIKRQDCSFSVGLLGLQNTWDFPDAALTAIALPVLGESSCRNNSDTSLS